MKRKSVFTGLDHYIDQAYISKQQSVPHIRGCTEFARHKSVSPTQKQKLQVFSYSNGTIPVRFKNAITTTQKTLEKARRGISVFEGSESFTKARNTKSLPFFESRELKQDLSHYLDLSVAQCQYDDKMPDSNKAEIVDLLRRKSMTKQRAHNPKSITIIPDNDDDDKKESPITNI